MARIRVYELARALDIGAKDVLEHARDLDIHVTTALSGLADSEADLIRLAVERANGEGDGQAAALLLPRPDPAAPPALPAPPSAATEALPAPDPAAPVALQDGDQAAIPAPDPTAPPLPVAPHLAPDAPDQVLVELDGETMPGGVAVLTTEVEELPLPEVLEPLPEPSRPDRLLRLRAALAGWAIPAAIGAFLAIVLVLRFRAIGLLGINSDEVVYSGQAASLAGVEGFVDRFSVFRAHPLLFQFALSLVYRFEFIDIAGRYVAAVFGLLTIPVTYLFGKDLFGRRVALTGAAFLAIMPYHVVVSRQALLEAPLALFFTVTMFAFARYRITRRVGWALMIGVAAGMTFLSKEVGILVLGVVAVVVLVEGRYSIRHLLAGVAAFSLTVLPHFLAARMAEKGAEAGGGWIQYLIWQTSRPPNHPGRFYFFNLPQYFGVPLLILVIVGIWLSVRTDRERRRNLIALAWLVVPFLFFQVWKVKGYHYLLPIAPVAALFGARALWAIRSSGWARAKQAFGAVLAVTVVTMIWVAALNGPITQNYARIGDAGYAGIPGGKEAALWMATETPEGARALTIGPSFSNIIKFYANRETLALSVSPNPIRTNPAYEAVRNPDYLLRWGLVEYIVYDVYSAERTAHFANRLLDFVDRYGGDVVHEEMALRVDADGDHYLTPVVRIYRVAPVGTGGGAGA